MIKREDKTIPKAKWISQPLWEKFKALMPVACVDMIFQNRNGAILYGFRIISPYKDVWALLGNRLLRGEGLIQIAERIANEYNVGIDSSKLYLNGVFPILFPDRSDVSISIAATNATGNPKPDKKEFSEFVWCSSPPNGLAENYLKMITKWYKARKSREFLKINKLERFEFI